MGAADGNVNPGWPAALTKSGPTSRASHENHGTEVGAGRRYVPDCIGRRPRRREQDLRSRGLPLGQPPVPATTCSSNTGVPARCRDDFAVIHHVVSCAARASGSADWGAIDMLRVRQPVAFRGSAESAARSTSRGERERRERRRPQRGRETRKLLRSPAGRGNLDSARLAPTPE